MKTPTKNVLLGLPRPFFVLAPMDDVTDTVFRQIIASCYQPDLFITEFVNVDGLQSPGRDKLLPKLYFTTQEQPICAQLWGKDPKNYLKTAREIAKMGFTGIDVNMGCPDKSVVKNGCGSALINNRELAAEIIAATKKGVAGKLPVSVKIRTGFNKVDFSWPEFILSQGVDMLTVHGRTTKEMSKVPARWEDIGKIREMRDKIAPNTLIVGNGDVTSRQQGEELAKKYKLDGIMIGRGALANPFVFAKTNKWAELAPRQKIELYKKHVELFAKTWPNGEHSIQTLKKFAKAYINGFDGASDLRAQIMQQNSLDDMFAAIDGYESLAK
jgi:nifR3 family TIM-barrel protein